MMKISKLAVGVVLAALGATGGCKRDTRRVIGMVPKGATQMFWQAVHAGAVKAAWESNLELLWNAPAVESDRSRQIAIVDAMINRGVDGLALAPVDRLALVNVVNRGIDRGIPVAVFDSALNSKRIISYIATDNREGGRLAARRMASILNGKGQVAIISDMPGSASTTERVNGFHEEAKARGLEILTVQYVMADRAKARAVTENWVTAHADLRGIFADHENAAVGAALALSSRQNQGVRLIGFDSSEQLVSFLRAGQIDSLVVQNPFRMGYEAVRVLAMKLSKKNPEPMINTGSTLVTKAELDRPDIQRLVFPDLTPYLGSGAR